MKYSILILLFGFLSVLGYSQDSIVLKRAYIWELDSEEITNSGKEFISDLCDSISSYREKGKEVNVLFTEEILRNGSMCKSAKYLESLKSNCLQQLGSGRIAGVEFSSHCERVDSFEHIKPHFIWYYVMVILH